MAIDPQILQSAQSAQSAQPNAPASATTPAAAPSSAAPVLSAATNTGTSTGANAGTDSDAAAASPDVSELLGNAAKQARGYIPGLVNGSLVAVHNGGVGDKGNVNIYRADDLKGAILTEPIQYKTYDGGVGPDGMPIATTRVLTPDGKTSMYDYYQKASAATRQLLDINTKQSQQQASTALNQAKSTPLDHDVHYDSYEKGLDKDGNPIPTRRTIPADGKTTKYDAFVAKERADRQLATLQGKFEAAEKARQAAANVTKTQQENDPLFKLENDPSTMAGEKGPAVLATAQARLADPNTQPSEKARWQRVAVQAQNSIKATDKQKANEKAAEQAVTQGDPDAAGKLLADGTLTLEELKSRQVTPQFITQTVNAAKKYDSTFNAPQAAADAKIAGSEANQQFFGNVDSLITRGGTLDQVSAAAKNLQNGQIPVFNTIANAASAAVGKGPVAAYAAGILGVADDYAKVMGGSVGSDTARQQVLDRVNAAQSPEQIDAVLNQFRQQIMSQRQGRIGTNRYLRNMHPVPDGALPSIQVTDPRGGIHTFPDQASADRFKQKAGIQ